MTVPLRSGHGSGLAAAGRRLDRTIRAQGAGAGLDRAATGPFTGAAKCGEVALHTAYLHTHGERAGDATRRARRHRRCPLADTIVRGPYVV